MISKFDNGHWLPKRHWVELDGQRYIVTWGDDEITYIQVVYSGGVFRTMTRRHIDVDGPTGRKVAEAAYKLTGRSRPQA